MFFVQVAVFYGIVKFANGSVFAPIEGILIVDIPVMEGRPTVDIPVMEGRLTVDIPVMDLQDPVTPCKQNRSTCLALAGFHDADFRTPEKLWLVKTANRGRPHGAASTYGRSAIVAHSKRGTSGGFLSNRRARTQPPVQTTWSTVALVPVVKYVKEVVKHGKNGRFQRGSLAQVRLKFPHMNLRDGTIRRCFYNGDQLLEDATLVTRSALGNHCRASRRRKGMRAITSQGQRRTCVGPLYATGLWHYEMRCLQLQVPEAALVAYFLDELELHKEVLMNVLKTVPDEHQNRKEWASELKAISRRIDRFEYASGSKRSKAVKELKQALHVRKYTVQKRSDLTPDQQRQSVLLKKQTCQPFYKGSFSG